MCIFFLCSSHGIPLSASGEEFQVSVSLAKPKTLPPPQATEEWHWDEDNTVRVSFQDFLHKKGRKKKDQPTYLFASQLSRRQIWLDPPTKRSFSLQQHRLQQFTEELASFRVPLRNNRTQAAHALAVFPDDTIHGRLSGGIKTIEPNFAHRDIISFDKETYGGA